MNIEIKTFQDLTKEELYEILKLRAEVFVVEQRCFYLDPDDKDYQSMHLMMKENGEIASYLRILPKGLSYETASIGRVLTPRHHRGKGFSRKAMQTAISWIKKHWEEEKITIGAQLYLHNFYASLGFVSVGKPYLDAEVEHIDMVLEL